MDEALIAWFAGLFDGEGCIHIAKNGNVRLTVRMTDRDLIERINALFPTTSKIGAVTPKPGLPHHRQPKTQYAWNVGQSERISEILTLILPWLGARRRAKALEALNHLETRPGVGGHNRLKTHCAQGHEYTAENTYIRLGTDHRHCRKCMTAWAAAYRAKFGPGPGRGAFNQAKTHCPHGHLYSDENTYVPPGKTARVCRTCRKLYKDAYDARRRRS